jgi:DNA repair protein RecN (Recombination protein N)
LLVAMLVELCIRDLALIEGVDLSFGPGLGVVTGETGAGKSLLVGALELLLGARPRGDAAGWVREGAARARVEGRFVLAPGPALERVRAFLAAELPAVHEEWSGATSDADAELVVGRAVARDGRSKAHVDQRPVSMKALKSLVPLLLEIHGQNEHQRLLEPAEQRGLVDAFGGLTELASEYRARRATWLSQLDRLERADEEAAARSGRLDYLRFQLDELERAAPERGEKARLVEEREVLRGAERLRAERGARVDALSEGEGAALDVLREADRTVSRWRESIGALAGPSDALRGAALHLEEAAAGLRSFVDGITGDPARLEEVEERLVQLEHLERKHGAEADVLAERAEALAAEVLALEGEERDATNLTHELARARGALEDAAGRLAKARRSLRPKLSRAVGRSLSELGLRAAKVELSVEPRGPAPSPNARAADSDPAADRARFGSDGTDDVELLLAANPGEPPRPLRHVASGGEAARIMLALRAVLAACDRGRTLVFDEVDAGVGGRLGPKVGAHLRALGESHQVLCVTHLPAIAALADTHLRVTKETHRGRTRTAVVELGGDARVQEIADMIAGGAGEATAQAEARRLLEAR